MWRKALCVLVAVLFTPAPPLGAQALDPDVKKGIALVDEGDYDGAILTLDNAARRLAADKSKVNDLSQAYLYLGIAYIGKGHDAAAKAKFREAIAQIKDLSLSPDKFPPKVIDIFEAAKDEESRKLDAAATAAAAPGAAETKAKSSAGGAKKGGGGKALLIVGGIAAVGAGVAVAAGGGGGNGGSSVPTTTTQPPETRQTLTFGGTLPNAGGTYECHQAVATKAGTLEARLTWTNGQIELGIGCQEHDPPYTQCGTSTRTANTSAFLTVAVTQKAYDVCVSNNSGTRDTYTLVVLFP
jgi:hypothetical protein